MNRNESTSQRAARVKWSLANAALVVGAVGAAAWLLFGVTNAETPSSTEPVAVVESRPTTRSVRLPSTKLAAATIRVQSAAVRSLTPTHTVPGRIEYDTSRRLQLRLPAECVVKEVLVRPGQRVKAGAKLAVLTSKQVGLARDAVQQGEEDLRLVRFQQQWTNNIAGNVQDLLASLAQSPQMVELETIYKDRPLGKYRAKLIAAYSTFILTTHAQQNSETLREQGVLSGRTSRDRRSQLEQARASFQSVCEETKYRVAVEKQTAATTVARAERALKISVEQFAALLGPYGTSQETTNDSLSEFILKAPFAGRIEQRHVRPAAVVAANSPLLTLADTDVLWVAAQIHEGNWQAAAMTVGQTVHVRSPATGDRVFTATIEFVGAAVDPDTRALPLIATIENVDQLFKPGMFVWVTVPMDSARQTLAVPPSAVMRHEGAAFVFVEEAGDQFRRIDITTGLETEDWIEVRDGLHGGEQVVVSGAFVLKSELLLEQEEG